MSTTALQLAGLGAATGLEGHLPECDRDRHDRRPDRSDWMDCLWCWSALSVPEIATLVDANEDCAALLASGSTDTVAWVIASGDLLDIVERVRAEEILVPSVRTLSDRLRSMLRGPLDALSSRLGAATAADGPVERRCHRGAGALTAAAVQAPEHRAVLDTLPRSVATRLGELAATLSAATQLRGVLSVLEQLHWFGLPALRTQPEWARRHAAGQALRPGRPGAAPTGPTPGSLEALVIESVIDQVTTELLELGVALAQAAPPVTLVRTVDDEPMSPATRALVWRLARFDWALTYADSGLATGWHARDEGDRRCVDVPWYVAFSIRVTEPLGLVSATHRDRPVVQPIVESTTTGGAAPRKKIPG